MDGEAEITSEKFFFKRRKLRIREIEEQQQPYEDHEQSAMNQEDNQRNTQGTCLDEVKDLKFHASDLLNDLNTWANRNNFHLNKTEGTKVNKDGFYRSFVCNEKACKFSLTFHLDKSGEYYQLNQNLGNKNNIISNGNIISITNY